MKRNIDSIKKYCSFLLCVCVCVCVCIHYIIPVKNYGISNIGDAKIKDRVDTEIDTTSISPILGNIYLLIQWWAEKFILWCYIYWWLFVQWDPSTAILVEEVCGPQIGLCWKLNLIWSHSMRIFWSAYELFNQPSYSTHTHKHIYIIKNNGQ